MLFDASKELCEETLRPPRRLIGMSFRWSIPWQVALQQSLPPLSPPPVILQQSRLSVERPSADGLCLTSLLSQKGPQSTHNFLLRPVPPRRVSELLKSPPQLAVAEENDLSPFRVRDRHRHTAFPSRHRDGVGLQADSKFHHLRSSESLLGTAGMSACATKTGPWFATLRLKHDCQRCERRYARTGTESRPIDAG